MNEGPGRIVPFRFDMNALVRRSVATLYSHLVTRPTGQALRLGIESQIGELAAPCVSVLDFAEVVVLDYSCADEAVAKLLQRYQREDRPAEAYFVARGVDDRHREMLEEVLDRHDLALVTEVEGEGYTLLGPVPPLETALWTALERWGHARPADLAGEAGAEEADAAAALDRLLGWRVAVRHGVTGTVHALSALASPAA